MGVKEKTESSMAQSQPLEGSQSFPLVLLLRASQRCCRDAERRSQGQREKGRLQSGTLLKIQEGQQSVKAFNNILFRRLPEGLMCHYVNMSQGYKKHKWIYALFCVFFSISQDKCLVFTPNQSHH